MKKAILLLSGGLDSATTAAIAKEWGYQLYAISFNYGQRHNIELQKAKELAEALELKEHKIANIDLRMFGGSALTDDISVPKNQLNKQRIPITYVPARNTIFLSYALAYAETIGAFDIFIGANILDYSGYPDCRPEFLESFEQMANKALVATVKGDKRINIQSPLIKMSKAEIIKEGLRLGIDYSMTISCYDPLPNGISCGECDSCMLRKNGFKELDIEENIYE